MRITQHIDLPENILLAQREGKLVIFAGAGVSMDPPASLPNFLGLATRLASDANRPGPTEEQQGTLDEFIGQLGRGGVEVHERTRRIIAESKQANAIHHDLLKLFRSAEDVRLITTNFDSHFTSAATDEFGPETIEIYRAPALPTGHDFSGVVYLHGSADKNASQLILTAQDFGDAYLYERWATNFLVRMFDTWTVLFVGYSHGDVLMQYLSRALSRNTRPRYVLTDNDGPKWRELGVIPILYPRLETTPHHVLLHDGISRWAQMSQMGFLEHEAKISKLVEGAPPEDPTEQDYLRDCLSDEPRAKLFVKYARDPGWLQWLEDVPVFSSLWKPDEDLVPSSLHLAFWFAEHFVAHHMEEALSVYLHRGQHPHPRLVSAILTEFHRNPPPSAALAKWISVILGGAPPQYEDLFDYALANCSWPNDRQAALILFGYLTTPRLTLKPSFAEFFGGGEKIGFDVVATGSGFWLREAWEKIFRPNIADCAKELIALVSHNLLLARRMYVAAAGDSGFDPQSFGRSSIEPHEQNHHSLGEGLDILVDAGRDALEALLSQSHDAGACQIRDWADSGSRLLERLAIHGVRKDPGMSADDKIEWVLTRGYLFAFGLKHEVFQLLADSFAHLSDESKEALLDAVDQGPRDEPQDEEERRTYEYEKYNVLVWLNAAAPTDALVSERLAAMRAVHTEFEPRDHPDFDSWMSEGYGAPTSGVSAEELLTKNPADDQDFEYIVSFLLGEGAALRSDKWERSERGAEASYKRFPWGLEFLRRLQTTERFDPDLWTPILEGWTKAGLTSSDWDAALSILEAVSDPCPLAHPISRLLYEGSKREDSALPEELIGRAIQVATRLLDECPGADSAILDARRGRWLDRAINSPGGRVAEFLLQVFAGYWRAHRDEWAGMPDSFADLFVDILRRNTPTKQFGTVVLVSHAHFFYAADRDWTVEKILPLFGWGTDPLAAEQAWNGFLAWGKLNTQALVDDLLPRYEETFDHLGALGDRLQHQFMTHLAVIATDHVTSPTEHGWLGRFTAAASADARKEFISSLQYVLRNRTSQIRHEAFERWLGGYWQGRNEGVPIGWADEELRELPQLAINLEEDFVNAVELLTQSRRIDQGQNSTAMYQLAKSSLPDSHPDAVSRMLLWMLEETQPPFWVTSVREVFERLSAAGADAELLRRLQEQLTRLG